jgi:hypothetical protein
MSDDVWSNSEVGDCELPDVVKVEDELDRRCVAGTLGWGADDLDAVRCQSALSPEGLLRRVGWMSSRLAKAFVRFITLLKLSKLQLWLMQPELLTVGWRNYCLQLAFVQQRYESCRCHCHCHRSQWR